jgi:hypothetical protein
MSIRSNFKDYYDGVASPDPVLYVRERKILPIPADILGGKDSSSLNWNKNHKLFCWPFAKSHFHGTAFWKSKGDWRTKTESTDNIPYECIVFGFCGRIYPVVVAIKRDFRLGQFDRFPYSPFCKSTPFVDIRSVQFQDADIHGIINGQKEGFGYVYKHPSKILHESYTIDEVSKVLNEIRGTAVASQIFQRFKTPAFIIRQKNYVDENINTNESMVIDVNPNLGEWGFSQVVDPYQAWQDISAFITNDLVDDKWKEILKMPDKVLIESHGFDMKYGFRKEPTKKRKK